MLSPGQCVALRGPPGTSATELRRSLHWLPVRRRVDYKLALITFKGTTHWLPGLHSMSTDPQELCARLIWTRFYRAMTRSVVKL